MTSPDLDPYLRIVLLFDQDPTAGQFLGEDGAGGFAGAVFRMAREIERLSTQVLPAGNIPLPQNAAEADAMQKIGFAWLKAHAPDRLTEAGLAATTPAIVRQEVFTALSEPDYQLLDRLDRDNASRGSRYVNEDDAGLWRQGVRLSESGLIAIEPHPKGGVFHITRLGEKALAGFRHSPKVQTSTNPQRNHYTERYDGID